MTLLCLNNSSWVTLCELNASQSTSLWFGLHENRRLHFGDYTLALHAESAETQLNNSPLFHMHTTSSRHWTKMPKQGHIVHFVELYKISFFCHHLAPPESTVCSNQFRTICCGIAWEPRWQMGTGARKQWRLTREPLSCIQGLSDLATTLASAVLTWGHTGERRGAVFKWKKQQHSCLM